LDASARPVSCGYGGGGNNNSQADITHRFCLSLRFFKFLPIRLKQLVYFVKFICKTSLFSPFFYSINYLPARKTHSQKDTHYIKCSVKNQDNKDLKINNFLLNKKPK
jgi:hypothetical protein